MKTITIFAAILASIFIKFEAFGSADEDMVTPRTFSRVLLGASKISNYEAFLRTQSVLDHFSAEPEPSFRDWLEPLAGRQSVENMNDLLRWLDPKKQFQNFSTVVERPGGVVLTTFLDFRSRRVMDFEIALKKDKNSTDGNLHLSHNSLVGLRVALDPGHMGGHLWDERTGKFVYDKQTGRRLSEGVINLQTVLLLEERLRRRGVEVMVTHRHLGPVGSLSWEDLDIQGYGRQWLNTVTLESWFRNLLEKAPIGNLLYEHFAASAEMQRIFSEKMRYQYYILRADLDARTESIESFKPDLSMVIHYDTNSPENDPNGLSSYKYSRVKTYVAGSFLPEEFSGRRDRAYFTNHLLDQTRWEQSLKLSRSVIYSLAKELELDLESNTYGGATVIEPGIMARNLRLTRMNTVAPMTYVECLYYSDPDEFNALAQKQYSMKINGEQTYYSDRLVKVVDGLERGISNYLETR